tara:strand:+ start:4552 stop:5577 length:1026 start_codon:yes stop_codon:yes gene_type:complete
MVHKSKIRITERELKNIVESVNHRWKLSSTKLLDFGIVNPIYQLKINSKDYILKVCNPMWEYWKVDKEVLALNLLKEKTNIPIPEVIHMDSSKKIISYKYFIMEKLDGVPLHKNCFKFSFRELKKIFQQLGDYLTQIHSITFNNFGGFVQKKSINIVAMGEIYSESKKVDPGPFNSWKEQFSAFVEKTLEGIQTKKLRKYSLIIDRHIRDNLYLLDNVDIKPCFIHGDYAMSNVLVTKQGVSGLVDLEWAYAGCAESEYSRAETYFFGVTSPLKYKSKLQKEFSKSYKIKRLPEYPKRKTLYEAFTCLNELNAYPWLIESMTSKQVKEYDQKLELTIEDFQ